jgi:ABC-type amino acid transport substrate-binding protein
MKYLMSLFCALCLLAPTLSAQSGKPQLVIGANFWQAPDSLTEMEIENGNVNFVDIFDYQVLQILVKSLQPKYDLRLKKIPQTQREEALLTTDSALKVDVLLFSFSDNIARRKKGIVFSEPYYTSKGIGLFATNRLLEPDAVWHGSHRVGLIENSTADIELQDAMERNKKLRILRTASMGPSVDSLLNGQVDIVAGDISRMSYFVSKHPEIVFLGNLQTPNSQIGDGFYVAMRPENKYLKAEIDKILLFNKPAIDGFEEKYLSNPVSFTLSTQLSDAERQTVSRWLLIGVPCLSLLVLALTLWYFLRKRMNNVVDPKTMDNLKKAIERAATDAVETINDELNSSLVWEKGIESFQQCEKSILYVGSGGYMSSKGEEGAKWREAIYQCLNRKKEFIRIVDLPDLRFLKASQRSESYMVRFYTWLIIQYLDLCRYKDNLELYNSRGAAFWGVGNIMLFKDEASVLIFTSSDKGKMGTFLTNKSLIPPLRKDILETKEFGVRLYPEDIEREYLKGFPILLNLVHKMGKMLASDEILTEAHMALIEERVRDHVRSFEAWEDDNTAPI